MCCFVTVRKPCSHVAFFPDTLTLYCVLMSVTTGTKGILKGDRRGERIIIIIIFFFKSAVLFSVSRIRPRSIGYMDTAVCSINIFDVIMKVRRDHRTILSRIMVSFVKLANLVILIKKMHTLQNGHL